LVGHFEIRLSRSRFDGSMTDGRPAFEVLETIWELVCDLTDAGVISWTVVREESMVGRSSIG
jgi:hypothetical protein